MWKQVAIGGAVAAAILGVGTASLAASGSTTAGKPSASSPAAGKHAAGPLRHALHGTWVSQDPDSTGYLTHTAARGSVSAVSPTSITVKAADGVSLTFAVNGDTTVRLRTAGKGAASTIGAVKTGEMVAVTGKGSPSVATAIVAVTK